MTSRRQVPLILFLQSGRLRQFRALLDLAVDVARKILRAAAERVEALRAQAGNDVGGGERLVGRAREALDDLARRASGRQQAEPQAEVEARQARPRHGGGGGGGAGGRRGGRG